MKKLFFTAIAVVGFGMNSWGHTIEKEENNFCNYDDSIILQDCVDCYELAWNVELMVYGVNNTKSGYELFERVYDFCASSGNCCNCIEGN
ncbi:MAG: hypothetical protein KGZ81_13150 [Flavobacteriales bacterium]|nr:hypothetical protein [Flavobacteriales bacterium]